MSAEIPVLRMEEALDFWRKKISVTASDFYALAEEYRVYAFMVAKFEQIDKVRAVMKSLDRALAQGKTMAEWRENITPFFKRAGWTGNTRYRIDTIYRTNIQTAYNAGRWAQAQDGKSDRPYGMYDAVLDGRTRPTHAAQDGKVYPLNHRFWLQWWPPNGFNCRCTVRTLSDSDLKDMGIKERDEIEGVPDEGFQANPGISPGEARIHALNPSKKLDGYSSMFRQYFLEAARHYPYQLVAKYLDEPDTRSLRTLIEVQDRGGLDGYEDWVDKVAKELDVGGGVAKRDRLYPVGNIPDTALTVLGVNPRLALVAMRDEDVVHMLREVKKNKLKLHEIKSIPQKLRDPDVKWRKVVQKKRGREIVTAIGEWQRTEDRWLRVVILTDYRVGDMLVNIVRSGRAIKEGDVGN